MLVQVGSPRSPRRQGPHLRIVAALRVCSGMLALLWAGASFATLAGTASAAPPNPPVVVAAKMPSIKISGQQTGLVRNLRRGGIRRQHRDQRRQPGFRRCSPRVRPALAWCEQFTDETGKNIGPYAADFPAFTSPFGGGLAPNTPITLTITTYSGPSLTGSIASVSTLVFD